MGTTGGTGEANLSATAMNIYSGPVRHFDTTLSAINSQRRTSNRWRSNKDAYVSL